MMRVNSGNLQIFWTGDSLSRATAPWPEPTAKKVQLFPPGGVDGCDHELITKNPNDAPGGEMPEIALGGWCEKSARTCDALGGLGG